MVYSISLGFRLIFLAVGMFILLAILSASEGPLFVRGNAIALILCTVCFLGALYLERWVFDKDENVFEQHVGLIGLYKTKTRPMDTLKKVVVNEHGKSISGMFRKRGESPPRAVILSVYDNEDKVYRMDIVRGMGARDLRRTAESISEFCSIPLEDNRQDENS